MNINLKNKKLIAVLVAAVIAIVGGVVWKINQKTNVLNEKISPKISGYDTQGSFEIDSFEFAKKIALPIAEKEKLSDDAKEQIITNASTGYEIIRGESAEEYLENKSSTITQEDHEHVAEFIKLIKTVHVDAYKVTAKPKLNDYNTRCYNLKNGDKVTVSVKSGDGCPIADSEKTFKISGLKKIKQVKVSSLYKHMSLKVQGISGKGCCTARVKLDSYAKDIVGRGISNPKLVGVSSSKDTLTNGEKVRADIEAWIPEANKAMYGSGRKLVYDNKDLTFTVKGLISIKNLDYGDILKELESNVREKYDKKHVFLSYFPGYSNNDDNFRLSLVCSIKDSFGESTRAFAYNDLIIENGKLVKTTSSRIENATSFGEKMSDYETHATNDDSYFELQ